MAIVYLATIPTGTIAVIVTSDGVVGVEAKFHESQLNAILDRLLPMTGALSRKSLDEAVGLEAQESPVADGVGDASHDDANGSLRREWFKSAVRQLLPMLGDQLIGSLAAALRMNSVQRVYLVPGGRLSLLPLHASSYRVGDGHAIFSDEFIVSYVPNARSLRHALRQDEGRTSSASFFAVANPSSGREPLAAAELEAARAAEMFVEAQVLGGKSATRGEVLERMSHATYLHFACHGLFTPESPLESHLALTGGDVLSLRDFLTGRARADNARLVALSACQTALIESQRLPDEFIGLPAGVLQAGVPDVLGTLWAVDDLSTALLMAKFYELHLAGALPAEALRRAQQWLRWATSGELAAIFTSERKRWNVQEAETLASRSRCVIEGLARFALDDPDAQPYADEPFYWAPFVLVGA